MCSKIYNLSIWWFSSFYMLKIKCIFAYSVWILIFYAELFVSYNIQPLVPWWTQRSLKLIHPISINVQSWRHNDVWMFLYKDNRILLQRLVAIYCAAEGPLPFCIHLCRHLGSVEVFRDEILVAFFIWITVYVGIHCDIYEHGNIWNKSL